MVSVVTLLSVQITCAVCPLLGVNISCFACMCRCALIIVVYAAISVLLFLYFYLFFLPTRYVGRECFVGWMLLMLLYSAVLTPALSCHVVSER